MRREKGVFLSSVFFLFNSKEKPLNAAFSFSFFLFLDLFSRGERDYWIIFVVFLCLERRKKVPGFMRYFFFFYFSRGRERERKREVFISPPFSFPSFFFPNSVIL
jgi:hypothetical protein